MAEEVGDVLVIEDGRDGVQVLHNTTPEIVQAAARVAAPPDDGSLSLDPADYDDDAIPTEPDDVDIPSDEVADAEVQPDETGVTDTEEAPPADEAEAGWPADLLTDAADFGYSEELARQFPTPEALRTHLDTLIAQQAAEGHQAREVPVRVEPARPQAVVPVQQGAFNPEEVYAALDAAASDLGEGDASGAAFGKVKQFVAGILEHSKAQDARVETLIDEFVGNSLDTYFTSLGEDYAETFGVGDRHTLDRKSPQWANRERFCELRDDLAAGRMARRQPPLQEAALRRAALRALTNDNAASKERRSIAEKADKRQRQITSAPASKARRRLTGRAAALAHLSEAMGVSDANDAEVAEFEAAFDII